jgi:hypothetical protein
VLGQTRTEQADPSSLPNLGPVDRVAVWCHVTDVERDQIAAAQLTVDRQIEQRRSRVRPSNCRLAQIDHT